LIGDGSGAPTAATLTAGNGISITNGAGSITIESTVTGGSGGIGDILQGGNSFGTTMTIGTNDNYALSFETNGSNRITIANTGEVTFTGAIVGTTASFSGTVSGADAVDADEFVTKGQLDTAISNIDSGLQGSGSEGQ